MLAKSLMGLSSQVQRYGDAALFILKHPELSTGEETDYRNAAPE